ncbi:hypothetical protein CLV47_10589 [Antricoccus suffuscus]|uniref:Ribbon-helix-helix CopG family protein n=2 Tax=Antricoccus suffuscus TaxID=1629062 RepID=A0A2T1A1U7_9ACTN|nr:hypothetical protein CLV47_10589 [Antricoccus suffuscus]
MQSLVRSTRGAPHPGAWDVCSSRQSEAQLQRLCTTSGQNVAVKSSRNGAAAIVLATQPAGLKWYRFGMAMNVRIPEALDRQLEELAAREHVSKHSLVLQGVELIVRTRARREEIDRGIDFVMDHDAELLSRLEDA